MWKKKDIRPELDYVIQLCQSEDGARRLQIRAVGLEEPSPDAVFQTEVVPKELLMSYAFYEIAETVSLEGGGRFYLDAHVVWFTPEEFHALFSSTEFGPIPWHGGRPPRLPPK